MKERLIVCADGTWNTPDQEDSGVIAPTNVAKFAQSIAPVTPDGTAQMARYLDGVGTHGSWLDRLWAGLTGSGLDENIMLGHQFLMSYYEPGDEIWLFGFSRGAYTVRSLAGMIRNCGLLRQEHHGRLKAAMNLYRDTAPAAHPNGSRAVRFRAAYSHEVRIRFIGVWDTVGALGIPVLSRSRLVNRINRRHQFHDVQLSSRVDHACHAVAIDERRKPYEPAMWRQQDHARGRQVLVQRWFAGVHSNIGGGYNDARLSDIALNWMIRQASSAGLVMDPFQVGLLEIDHANDRRGEGVLRRPKPLGAMESRHISGDDVCCEGVHISAWRRHLHSPVGYRPRTLTDAVHRGVPVMDD